MPKARGYTEIIGIEYLEDVLNFMPKNLSRKFLRDTSEEAGQPVLLAAKANIRAASPTKKVDFGLFVESWTMRRTPRPGKNFGFRPQYDRSVKDEVYQRYGGKGKRNKSVWAINGPLWLEHGTTGNKKDGPPIRATGWFRRAVDLNIDKSEMLFKGILSRRINTFLSKSTKRSRRVLKSYFSRGVF